MNCVNPFYLEKESIWVPCGRCILCRIQRAKEWSVRLCHEIGYHEKTSFLTLTYDDEHLPEDSSVHKRELQLFFKRLRKELSKEDRKIVYYACGEYGDQFGRPHYHVIMFGMDNSKGDQEIIQKTWPFGRIHCGTATYDSCRYVADYVQKKLYGLRASEYTDAGLEQPFSLMSQKIGLQWAEDNYSSLIRNKGLTLHGAKQSIPRYYVKKLNIPTEWIKENADIQKTIKKSKYFLKHETGDYAGLTWLGQMNQRAKRLESEAKSRQNLYKKGEM